MQWPAAGGCSNIDEAPSPPELLGYTILHYLMGTLHNLNQKETPELYKSEMLPALCVEGKETQFLF